MQNTKHTGNINSIIASSHSNTPVVEIKNVALAGNGMARVVIDVTHTEASRKDHNVIAEALRQKFGGKMAAVAGSFHSIEKAPFTERISGVVSVVREAVAVTAESMKGFKAYASNMFMDDEKDIWVLRKTQAGQIMVKTTGIDDDITLMKHLESVSSSTCQGGLEYKRLVAQASSTSSRVQGGDFVSFVTPDNTIGVGFVVATAADSDEVLVLPVDGEEGEVIKREAVTEIHAQDNFPKFEQTKEEKVDEVVAASRGAIDVKFLLDYYKKVFARSPAYYAEFANRLKSHAFM